DGPSQDFTSPHSGNHSLSPAAFATVYDARALYSGAFDGTGERIALTGQSSSTWRTWQTSAALLACLQMFQRCSSCPVPEHLRAVPETREHPISTSNGRGAWRRT